jgi:hypothetical protein
MAVVIEIRILDAGEQFIDASARGGIGIARTRVLRNGFRRLLTGRGGAGRSGAGAAATGAGAFGVFTATCFFAQADPKMHRLVAAIMFRQKVLFI